MVFQYARLPLDAQILAQKFRAKGKRKLRLQIFAKKITLFVDARCAVFASQVKHKNVFQFLLFFRMRFLRTITFVFEFDAILAKDFCKWRNLLAQKIVFGGYEKCRRKIFCDVKNRGSQNQFLPRAAFFEQRAADAFYVESF